MMGGDIIYPFVKCLIWVEFYHLRWGRDVRQLQTCIWELRFLEVTLWWFSRYDKDDCSEKNMENLKSMLCSVVSKWKKLEGVLPMIQEEFQVGKKFESERIRSSEEVMSWFSQARIAVAQEEEQIRKITLEEKARAVGWLKPVEAIEHWKVWSSIIEGTIEECKLEIRGYCQILLYCTFKQRSLLSNDQILNFLEAVLKHLKGLVRCIAGETVPLKEQIETFEAKLMLLYAFFKLIPDDCVLELRDFKESLYDDINKVAWLTFFFWVKAGDEEIVDELILVLSDMAQKIVKPSGPDVASWYFRALKAMRLQQSGDAILLGQAVPGFLDLLFENLRVPLSEDFQILRDGLIILFTFLANPPEDYPKDDGLILIRDQVGDFLLRGSSPVTQMDDMKNGSCGEEVRLSDSLTMIERVKNKIGKLRNGIPDLLPYDFPRINGLGFIDFLLQNLKESAKGDKMQICFAKHLIVKIEHELVSLRPDLNDIFELQQEQKELQDAWLQVINLGYLTEHVVNSCFIYLDPIWYNMLRLADVLDKIKVIKRRLDTIKHSSSYSVHVFPNPVRSNGEISKQSWESRANNGMVGCEEEINMIVDQLTRGPKSLEVVSIVGMGGSGKTTLARKAYHTHQVRSHFHTFAFCTVSQVYNTRKLLLEILKEINGIFLNDHSKSDDDLAHMLYKQLSGKRYLVVMDDIWMIDAWKKVKSSFPNEKKGSRVIFTTREGEVAKKAKSRFIPHSKHLLYANESWELLRKTAFPQDGCPPNLLKVGQEIARNCGGLPLALALIGRLLARKGRSLRIWNEIAEKTTSFASEEGCSNVLEFSYKHLSEHLKSCFLYLGVFAEDESISSKKLMLLWIAEGFVQKSKRESLEIVAEEYLNELVDRSLLHVAKRSSDNRIKTCQLHDIMSDFCQRKAQEENLFQLINGNADCNSSHSNRYRVSINMDMKSFVDVELGDPGIKSLLYRNVWDSPYICDGSKSLFLKFQLVQVLDLENVMLTGQKNKVYRVIESMTFLVHLRYLAFSTRDRDIRIPSRMADLKYLETFILRRSNHAGDLWWSETFWRMERLRHLDVGRCYLIPCPPEWEAYPPLYNLECFSTLVLKPGTATILLKRLPNIRKLSCAFPSFLENNEILALDVLTKLESLKLSLGYGANVILPTSLEKLSLHGNRLPSQLGILPRLEVLKIRGYFMGWDIKEGHFPELKFLKLKTSILEEWHAPDGSFSRLEQFVLVDCYYLREIPASFGESATLKRIEVHSWNPILKRSALEIQNEQKDLGNEIQLVIGRRSPLPPFGKLCL